MPANIEDQKKPKKYLVLGGLVRDSGTSRLQYVSAHHVIEAYQVDKADCIISLTDEAMGSGRLPAMARTEANLIVLRPQQNPENYKQIPEK